MRGQGVRERDAGSFIPPIPIHLPNEGHISWAVGSNFVAPSADGSRRKGDGVPSFTEFPEKP